MAYLVIGNIFQNLFYMFDVFNGAVFADVLECILRIVYQIK